MICTCFDFTNNAFIQRC